MKKSEFKQIIKEEIQKAFNEIKIEKPGTTLFKFKDEFDGDKYYDFNGEEFSLNDYENALIYVGNNIKRIVNLLKQYKNETGITACKPTT